MSESGREIREFKAVVIRKNGEWFHVVIDVDLENLLVPTEALTIEIVAMGDGINVDIDNIAFHPLDHKLKATVFDGFGRDIATITSAGSVERNFFSEQNKRFATLNEDELELYAFSTSDGFKTTTKFTPENAFLEDFNDIQSRWMAKSFDNFTMSKNTLHHNVRGVDSMRMKNSVVSEESAALRLQYALPGTFSMLEMEFFDFKVKLMLDSLMVNGGKIADINKVGEILVLKHQRRLSIWIDGHLKCDALVGGQQSLKSLQINLQGEETFYVLAH